MRGFCYLTAFAIIFSAINIFAVQDCRKKNILFYGQITIKDRIQGQITERHELSELPVTWTDHDGGYDKIFVSLPKEFVSSDYRVQMTYKPMKKNLKSHQAKLLSSVEFAGRYELEGVHFFEQLVPNWNLRPIFLTLLLKKKAKTICSHRVHFPQFDD